MFKRTGVVLPLRKVEPNIVFSLSILYIMSIVALKRNSRRFQVPISGAAGGFSLNGGHRNQRPIANTNLSALYANTNGGCCGGNDPDIVKISTKNTKGYLYNNILYPVCPIGLVGATPPVIVVKNFSPDDRSQNEYIVNKVKAGAAACVTTKTDSGTDKTCLPDCKARSYHIGGKRFYTTYNAKNSGEYGQGAISAGEYLSAGLLKANCLPTPAALAPLPPALNNSSCYHC